MKILYILLAGYAVVSLLDNVSAEDLTSYTAWYNVTPYDRCLQQLSNSDIVAQCNVLKLDEDK